MAAVATGCIGDIGDGDGSADNPSSTQQASCSATADPIRRLTADEYINTVAALFPSVTLPALEPLPDERVDGFVGHVDGQSVSSLGVAAYEEMAVDVGEVAAGSLGAWAPCTDDAATCLQQIATELAAKAYRRPLEADEVSALEAYAEDVHGDHGLQEGVALVVQALLQSPFFLFRPELGMAAGDGEVVALDDYEMASRLSYFFLDTMPDEALFAAAAAGELTTDAGLIAQAERLVADERARSVLTGFFGEWLRLYALDELALDPTTFPELDDALRTDLAESVRLYLDEVLWEADSYQSLVTGHFGYVNDRLAPLFGVEPPGTDELVRVELPADQRSGVLTQPGLLASTSHGISHSPIYRGVTMLENILCSKIPAPPPGILDDFDPVDVPAEEVCTVRDRIAKTHTVGLNCQGCHAAIDGAGFTFESYDALGRFRTEENGCAVDASGWFPGTLGEVTDAVDMASKLAASEDASQCMVSHLYRYGLGRSEVEGDTCYVEAIHEAMREGGGSLQGMILALVTSPAFRTRPAGDVAVGGEN